LGQGQVFSYDRNEVRRVLDRWKKSERGQAIVETALVVPLIILLIMGMVELGRVSNAYLAVTHASRHGARYAAVGGSNEEIISKVKNAASPLDTSQLTVIIDPAQNRQSGEDIKVTVTYPVRMLTPIAGFLFSNTVTVRSDVTMRIE
jgi:Flp pilus assembly protein TadG